MIEIFKITLTPYETTFKRDGERVDENQLVRKIKEITPFPVNENGVLVYMSEKEYQGIQEMTKLLQRDI